MSTAYHDDNPGRPYFRHLPEWIYQHPAWTGRADRPDRLTPGERWSLHIIAGQCNVRSDDAGSVRGCLCGRKLWRRIGCSERGFWNMYGKFRRLGFVVKVSQGGGAGRANELGIPDQPGALDHLAVGDDPRYHCQTKTLNRVQGYRAHRAEKTMNTIQGKPCTKGRASSSSNPELSRDYQHPGPSRNGEAHRQRPRGNTARAPEVPPQPFDDDQDTLLRQLPDQADNAKIKAVLIKHGISAGRAHRQAQNPLTTPRLVRDVLAQASRYRTTIRNSGAYIGGLMDDAIAQAKSDHLHQLQQDREAWHRRLVEANEMIDEMPAAELQERIDSSSTFNGLDAQALRADPVLRPEMARRLTSEIAIPRADSADQASVPAKPLFASTTTDARPKKGALT